VSIDVPTARSAPTIANPAAFIPVIAPAQAAAQSTRRPSPSMAIALHVRLPNGVEFNLDEASLDELATIVQMLGRLTCSASTRD
jgi:transposase